MKNSNSKYKTIAQIISLIISPFILIPTLFIYLVFQKYSGIQIQLFVMVKLFIFSLLPIFLLLLILKKTGKITSLDMTDRRERYLFNIISLIIILFFSLLTKHIGLEKLSGIVFTLLIGFIFLTLITFFWKISGHTSSVTFFLIIIFSFTNYFLFIGLPIIIAVSWARIYQKKHTLPQTIAGIILSLATYAFCKYINLI